MKKGILPNLVSISIIAREKTRCLTFVEFNVSGDYISGVNVFLLLNQGD